MTGQPVRGFARQVFAAPVFAALVFATPCIAVI
jgi:hypothetical protein